MGLNETRYQQLLQQLRKKPLDELWFSMNSGPENEAEYKLAGDLVLKEREERVARSRANAALFCSLVAVIISLLGLAVQGWKLWYDLTASPAPITTPSRTQKPTQPTPVVPP